MRFDLSKINNILSHHYLLPEPKDGVQALSPTVKKVIIDMLEEISRLEKKLEEAESELDAAYNEINSAL